MSEDHGLLDEGSWSDSISYNCSGGNSMEWEGAFGVGAEGNTQEEWDQIAYNGSNVWRFFFNFEDRPGNLIPDACNNDDFDRYNPEPWNFRYVIDVSDASNDNTYLSQPEPEDGEGESENKELGLLLELLGATGNIYVSAASVVVDYVMATRWGSSTNVDQEGNGEKYIFDIDVGGGYDDLPHATNDDERQVTDVSLRVNNEWNDDDRHCVLFMPEYTFEYWGPDPAYQSNCQCDPITKFQTVSPDDTWAPAGYACYDVA